MKKFYVKDLSGILGNEIKETFYLVGIQHTKSDGACWMSLLLKDRTGTVTGRIWGEYMDDSYEAMSHTVVEVIGKVELFHGRLELRIVRMKQVEDGKYERADFVKLLGAEKKKEVLQIIQQTMDQIREPSYQALCKWILKPTRLMELSEYPGSLEFHHDYAGGWIVLAADLVRLIEGALNLAEQAPFQKENLDRDLLITAALLHNIGLLKQVRTDAIIYWRSKRSYLVGLCADTIAFLVSANLHLPKAKQVEDMTLLLHLVVSALDRSVVPQTKEAVLFSSLLKSCSSVAAWDSCYVSQVDEGKKDRVYSEYFGYDLQF